MDIRPFRGWRYNTADVSAVIAPPYDILSDKQKTELLGRSDANIVAVDLPHVPPKEVGSDVEYAAAATLLKQWQDSGVMTQDDVPALYAYEQTYTWAGKTYQRRAILAGVRAMPLGEGIIPHEHTFAGPKADRLKLSEHTRTQLSPIFGFFDDSDAHAAEMLFAAGGDPVASGELNDVGEKLWAITDEKLITEVAKSLRHVPVYIADGHHRYTTAMNYRDALKAAGKIDDQHEANFVMFALVARDDPGLLVLPTHRIVHDLAKDFTLDRLVASAVEFDWQAVDVPADLSDADAFLRPFGPGAMALVNGDGQAQVAILKDRRAMRDAAPGECDAWRGLDVAVLHKLLLEKHIAPWRMENTDITYTPDGQAVVAACKAGASLGACLQGTPLSAVEAVADAGGSMPHKSTYFYPKLATGMVIKPLE